MNPRTNLKGSLGCLTVMVVLLLVTAYVATGRLNPIAVFSAKGIFGKVVVSVSLVVIGAVLLQAFAQFFLRFQIRLTSGKSADDLICLGCGQPLMPFISSHGLPIYCPQCRTWWHNGLACYSKGLEHQLSVPTVPCPTCRKKYSQSMGFFGEPDDS